MVDAPQGFTVNLLNQDREATATRSLDLSKEFLTAIGENFDLSRTADANTRLLQRGDSGNAVNPFETGDDPRDALGLAEDGEPDVFAPFGIDLGEGTGGDSPDGLGRADLEAALAASGRGRGAYSSSTGNGGAGLPFPITDALHQLVQQYPEVATGEITNSGTEKGPLYEEGWFQIGDTVYRYRAEFDPYDLSNVTWNGPLTDTYKIVTSKEAAPGAGDPYGDSRPPSPSPDQPAADGGAPAPATPADGGGSPPVVEPPHEGDPYGDSQPAGDDDDDDDAEKAAEGTKMPNPVDDPQPSGTISDIFTKGPGAGNPGTVTPLPDYIDIGVLTVGDASAIFTRGPGAGNPETTNPLPLGIDTGGLTGGDISQLLTQGARNPNTTTPLPAGIEAAPVSGGPAVIEIDLGDRFAGVGAPDGLDLDKP